MTRLVKKRPHRLTSEVMALCTARR